jgi:hypothetical protein
LAGHVPAGRPDRSRHPALVERGLPDRRTGFCEFRSEGRCWSSRLGSDSRSRPYPVYRLTEVDFHKETAWAEAEIAQARTMRAVPTMRQVSGRMTDMVRAWKLASEDPGARRGAAR